MEKKNIEEIEDEEDWVVIDSNDIQDMEKRNKSTKRKFKDLDFENNKEELNKKFKTIQKKFNPFN
jgi:hypothetical protein